MFIPIGLLLLRWQHDQHNSRVIQLNLLSSGHRLAQLGRGRFSHLLALTQSVQSCSGYGTGDKRQQKGTKL